MENKLNLEAIKSLIRQSKTSENIASVLVKRERFRPDTNLQHLRREISKMGLEASYEPYAAFWRGVQEIGLGSIVFGSRGSMRRFKWDYNYRQVLRAASSDVMAALRPIKEAGKKPKHINVVPKTTQVNPASRPVQISEKVLYVPLRMDFDTVVRLPSDLTLTERDMLIRAIKKA